MTSDPAKTRHADNFAFLRLLAATLVLYSHQRALTGRPEPTFIGIHSWGGLGVMIFFSISGFLVAQSWERDPHAGRFFARRLLHLVERHALKLKPGARRNVEAGLGQPLPTQAQA